MTCFIPNPRIIYIQTGKYKLTGSSNSHCANLWWILNLCSLLKESTCIKNYLFLFVEEFSNEDLENPIHHLLTDTTSSNHDYDEPEYSKCNCILMLFLIGVRCVNKTVHHTLKTYSYQHIFPQNCIVFIGNVVRHYRHSSTKRL